MTTRALLATAGLILALPALAQPPMKCGRGHFPPCPGPPPPPPPLTLAITFDPPNPTIPDNTPVGTPIANIIVTVSDGSPFGGSLGFGLPYGSDAGFCAIQGNQVILGAVPPPGASVQHCTITATQ